MQPTPLFQHIPQVTLKPVAMRLCFRIFSRLSTGSLSTQPNKVLFRSQLMGCLLSLAIPSAMAQFRVTGRITSRANQPAPYATIALIASKDSSLIKGAITDESGAFQIDNLAAGTYRLNVQYIGYIKQWVSSFALNETTPLADLGTIRLIESVENLTEVTVKGQRSLVEQKGDRMILNVANSVITKGNKVADLLQYAPLVRVTGDGIKVANKGNVLILVDGRQTGQGALEAFLQNFSAEDILKIEVLTNPPAKYDASFGAVIDIITKKSLAIGSNGRLAMNHSQGKYGRFTPDGSLNVQTRQWTVFSSVSGVLSDVYFDQLLERQFPASALDNKVDNLERNRGFSSFNGVDFSPNANHSLGLRLNGSWTNKTRDNRTVTSFRGPSAALDSLLYVLNQGRDRSPVYDLNAYYTGKLDSSGKQVSVNLTRSFLSRSSVQNLTYQRQTPESTPVGEPTFLRISNPTDQNSLIAQTDLSLPTKKGQWAVGVKYISIANDNELRQEQSRDGVYVTDLAFSSAGVYQEKTYAGYGSFSNSFRNGWSLKAGLRLEKTSQSLTSSNVSRTYAGLFPSLALSRAFKNKARLSLSYSRKIARPGLSNLVPFRTIVDPYSIVEGNPDLRPSFANTIDVYYSFGPVSLFANYTHTRDLIADVLFADPATNVYIQTTGNLDQVHDAYTGISWNQGLTTWWQTNSTFTLSATQTRSPIANVPGVVLGGNGVVLNSTNVFSLPRGYKAELSVSYSSPNRYTIWQTGSLYWASVSLTKAIFNLANLRVSFDDVFRTQVNRVSVRYGPVDIRSQSYRDAQRVRVALSYHFGKKTVKGATYRSLGNEAEKSRMGGR